MPRDKKKGRKGGIRPVTSTRTDMRDRDSRHGRQLQPQRTRRIEPVGGTSTATILIAFNQRFNRKAFENWLKDGAQKEDQTLEYRTLDFLETTHTIRLVVDMQNVTLVNKICAGSMFQGQKLEPRIQSVENIESASSKLRRLEQAFKALVQERLNGVSLDLTGVAEHPDPNKRIDWSAKDVGKAFCNALKHFCTGCKALVLDKNGLSNLSIFNGIARACPTIEVLSLQQNNINEFTQFRNINNLRLRSLSISGNPIAGPALDSKTRMNEAKKYFPRLEVLDGRQTKPIRFIDPNMVVDGFPLCELPPVKNGLVPPDLMDLAQFFVQTVLPKLANRATPEQELAAIYDSDAYFSVSLSPDLGAKHVQISPFVRVNRNLIKDSTTKTVTENLFEGPQRIVQAIKSLPLIFVIPTMLVCDAIDISPFSKVPEVQAKKTRFVQLTFCGTATIGGEQGERYSFRRVFVVLVSERGLAIRNDMLTLLPELGKNVALSSSAAVNLSNEEELIDKVVAATNIKRVHAREALQMSQGNVDAAVMAINQGRANGTLRMEHFN